MRLGVQKRESRTKPKRSWKAGMHQALPGHVSLPLTPSPSCHHSCGFNWWIRCEANFPFCEEPFFFPQWGRRIRVSARWYRVLFKPLMGDTLLGNPSRVRAGKTSVSSGDGDSPPRGSDTTQAYQLPAEGILSPGGGASREWGHPNSVTPEKTLTAICRNSFLVFQPQEQSTKGPFRQNRFSLVLSLKVLWSAVEGKNVWERW